MSIAATYVSQVTIVETGEGVFLGTDNTITTNGMNRSEGLTGATAVPVTKYSSFQKALAAGVGTIDLTSLPDFNGAAGAVTFLGLKVQMIKVRSKSDNANPITITKGASNGYGFGAAGATFTIPLEPDCEATIYLDDKAPDVAAGAKTFDLSGTGSQVLEVTLVAG